MTPRYTARVTDAPMPKRERLYDALTCVMADDVPPLRAWVENPVAAIVDHAVVQDPKEAWELFATHGLIPTSWIDDPRRVFESPCAFCDGGRARGLLGCPRCGGRGALRIAGLLAPHPPTVALAVALASDVPGVLAAESLAREHVAGFGLVPDYVIWTAGRTYDTAADAPRFGVLRAIAELGYRLRDLTGDAVVLVAPEL